MRRARKSLVRDGVRARLQPPPVLPSSARVGVNAVLGRTSPTCLERSLVLQAWLHAHDIETEIVVGVPRSQGGSDPDGSTSSNGFVAHAWLNVEANESLTNAYAEIYRIAAS